MFYNTTKNSIVKFYSKFTGIRLTPTINMIYNLLCGLFMQYSGFIFYTLNLIYLSLRHPQTGHLSGASCPTWVCPHTGHM